MRISACVICQNEEKWIERALRSLHWADEIVVVDALSKDQTPEIVKRHATVFLQHPWEGFRKQRQRAMDAARYDWIFFLDSDEYCTEELIQRMRAFQKMETEPPFSLYKIHRKEHFMGILYRYGCGNPSFQDRFFHRQRVQLVGEVHEYPAYEGEPGWIMESIYHDSFSSIEEMVEKTNRYSTLDAMSLYRKGKRYAWPVMFFSGVIMFYKGYVKKRGILDGPVGLILAILDGMTFFLRHAKLWVLWHFSGKTFCANKEKGLKEGIDEESTL